MTVAVPTERSGSERAAAAYAPIETAKLNGLDPEVYCAR